MHWPAFLHAGIESLSEMRAGKGRAFKDLHSGDGIFVMPNAWNAGSACMLEAAGFPAVGTTSAGIAFCLGLPDYEGALSRDAALEETGRIAGALRIPVSVDAENGYGHTPEEVAETIRRVADTGAVGASIEDYAAAYGTGGLYDRALSVERIEAAATAAASLAFPFSLAHRDVQDERRRALRLAEEHAGEDRRRPPAIVHRRAPPLEPSVLDRLTPAQAVLRKTRVVNPDSDMGSGRRLRNRRCVSTSSPSPGRHSTSGRGNLPRSWKQVRAWTTGGSEPVCVPILDGMTSRSRIFLDALWRPERPCRGGWRAC